MRLTVSQARARFTAARIARLATVDEHSHPHLVPVTFAVLGVAPDEATIVFAVDHKPKRTTALRRLANIAVNPQVAFLGDAYSEDWDQLWWVRADAVAGVLEGAPRELAIHVLRAKYVQYERVPPAGVVVGATVSRWSGWQSAASVISTTSPIVSSTDLPS